MIFYKVSDPSQGRIYIVGTQADARAINSDFEQIDIPTDKAGLRDSIQNLLDAAPTSTSVSLDVSVLVEWILDEATVSQVERIFEALGTRFKEAVNVANSDSL